MSPHCFCFVPVRVVIAVKLLAAPRRASVPEGCFGRNAAQGGAPGLWTLVAEPGHQWKIFPAGPDETRRSFGLPNYGIAGTLAYAAILRVNS